MLLGVAALAGNLGPTLVGILDPGKASAPQLTGTQTDRAPGSVEIVVHGVLPQGFPYASQPSIFSFPRLQVEATLDSICCGFVVLLKCLQRSAAWLRR